MNGDVIILDEDPPLRCIGLDLPSHEAKLTYWGLLQQIQEDPDDTELHGILHDFLLDMDYPEQAAMVVHQNPGMRDRILLYNLYSISYLFAPGHLPWLVTEASCSLLFWLTYGPALVRSQPLAYIHTDRSFPRGLLTSIFSQHHQRDYVPYCILQYLKNGSVVYDPARMDEITIHFPEGTSIHRALSAACLQYAWDREPAPFEYIPTDQKEKDAIQWLPTFMTWRFYSPNGTWPSMATTSQTFSEPWSN